MKATTSIRYNVTPWEEYCKNRISLAKSIVKRLEECGGSTNILQGKFIDGGTKLSQQYIIDTVGELEGLNLISQWNNMPKPTFISSLKNRKIV